MAVDLINYQKLEKHIAILKSASSDDVKSIEEQILRILQSHNQQIELNSMDFAARDSRKVVNRTGHARFRRGPSDPSTSSSPSPQTEPAKPVHLTSSPKPVELKMKSKVVEEIKSASTGISSGSSSITGEEGTVSNGKPLFGNAVTPAPRTFSSGKPPLPTSHRKRCRETELSQEFSVKPSSSRGCHCCKRRKMSIKREIKRVRTTGSSKVAADDIPSDQYSWKKYDQKLIPGSPFPRGYYRCNSAKGCPARKHVERDTKDPTVLILTYEGEHHHHRSQSRSNHRWMKMPETLTRLDNSNNDNNNNNRSNSVAGVCF